MDGYDEDEFEEASAISEGIHINLIGKDIETGVSSSMNINDEDIIEESFEKESESHIDDDFEISHLQEGRQGVDLLALPRYNDSTKSFVKNE
jgi:hypothetical protein